MTFSGITFGPLHIRKLHNTDEDVTLLARWLSDPRVLEFYEGRDSPFDEAAVRAKFFIKEDEGQTPCIVEYDGRPLGYLQFYPISAEEHELYGYPRDMTIYGMDQFIGEPDWWGRGIGTRMIQVIVEYLFRSAGVQRIVMDPRVENPRAVRSYEKCGFRIIRRMPGKEFHEGAWRDNWQMEVTPETAVPPAPFDTQTL